VLNVSSYEQGETHKTCSLNTTNKAKARNVELSKVATLKTTWKMFIIITIIIIIIIIIINCKWVCTQWQWYYNTQYNTTLYNTQKTQHTHTHIQNNTKHKNYKHNNTKLQTQCTQNYEHKVST
jgi:hypothetical protein